MKRRRMAATLLPDDAVRKILLRVSTDGAALFRCAVTCKQWCALVADPSFLRLCWPERACDPSSLLGFFDHGYDKHQPPFFSPISPGSVLGARRRPLTSFITGASHGVLNGAYPVAAHGGLLLMRVAGSLAVCNPLTGSCDVLPLLGCSSAAVLSREDCCSGETHTPLNCYSTTFFKVLAIVRGRHDQDGSIYTFTSSQPTWSAPRNCFDQVWLKGKFGCKLLLENEAVICRGVAHWLGLYVSHHQHYLTTHYYTFDVNVQTGHISYTEISIPRNQLDIRAYSRLKLIVTSEERLSLLHLQNEDLRLSTWTRGDDDGTWLHARVIDLKLPTHASVDHVCIRMWLGERSGTFIVDMRLDTRRCIYKTDIKTGVMEDVTTKMFEDGFRLTIVPMEIDWPALLMSRLGVINRY